MDLEERGQAVITRMRGIPALSHLPLDDLPSIPLGLLRRSATRLHAICRYRRGARKSEGVAPTDVRCIDVHPYALTDQWSRYADFLLYHEYIHALGIFNHGREFRELEALWPDEGARSMGQEFGRYLRRGPRSGYGSAHHAKTGTPGQGGETDVTGAGVAR